MSTEKETILEKISAYFPEFWVEKHGFHVKWNLGGCEQRRVIRLACVPNEL